MPGPSVRCPWCEDGAVTVWACDKHHNSGCPCEMPYTLTCPECDGSGVMACGFCGKPAKFGADDGEFYCSTECQEAAA